MGQPIRCSPEPLIVPRLTLTWNNGRSPKRSTPSTVSRTCRLARATPGRGGDEMSGAGGDCRNSGAGGREGLRIKTQPWAPIFPPGHTRLWAPAGARGLPETATLPGPSDCEFGRRQPSLMTIIEARSGEPTFERLNRRAGRRSPCHKQRYRSESEAISAAKHLRRVGFFGQRPYQCTAKNCSAWHLTTKPEFTSEPIHRFLAIAAW